jgi:predicted dinucleotide-binding enzyme
MGGKLRTIFTRAGYDVVFSYARNNDKLKKLARDTQGNAPAGTPGEAGKHADALLLAVHWSRIRQGTVRVVHWHCEDRSALSGT